MYINLRVDKIEVSTATNSLSVDLDGIDITEVIHEIGINRILDNIGQEAAFEHFGFKGATYQEIIEYFKK